MPRFKNYLITLLVLSFSISVKAQTVFKTPFGAKYHLASCRMVKNVSEQITVDKAKQLGLEPCKICLPQNSRAANVAIIHKAQGQGTTVQCSGLTKAGNRCKHKTSIGNGYCFQHQPK